MIKFKEKTLFIHDDNGDIVPFQIEELQAELAECFCSSGLVDESSFAEDIILSLDYFFNEQNSGNLYTTKDLTKFVSAILEDAGFLEVAKLYCDKKRFLEPLFPTTAASLNELLATKLFFSVDNAKKIAEKTSRIFQDCNISAAPLSLIAEMCKYVNISAVDKLDNNEPVSTPKKSVSSLYGYYIKDSALNKYLQDNLSDFQTLKYLKVGGISMIHSAIKIYINLSEDILLQELPQPFMELDLADRLYCIGKELDSVCDCICEKCRTIPELQVLNLPIYLNFINLKSFGVKFMGFNHPQGGNKFNKEIAEMVIAGMKNPVYRVIFKEKSPDFEKK
jgi:hypothetical protein